MTDERKPASETNETAPGGGGGRERRPSEDLAEGLELMLRAARKAVRGIDPARIEELGRRAVRSVENLDRDKVKKAAQSFDPRKIEEVAEEAGRELLAVVERVADRIEGIVSSKRSTPPPPDEKSDTSASQDPARRVRVEDE